VENGVEKLVSRKSFLRSHSRERRREEEREEEQGKRKIERNFKFEISHI